MTQTRYRTMMTFSVVFAAMALIMLIAVSPALALPSETGTTDTGTAAGASATTIAPRELVNPLGTESIPELIGRVITIFTAVAGSIALLMFVYGGVMWLASGGSADKIEKGKKAIIWAVIGLAVIFGGYAVLRLIFITLGARL